MKRILLGGVAAFALAFPAVAQQATVITSGGSGATTCAGITDAGTVCPKNIGTSGANVPLLSTANTWGAGQTFTAVAMSGTGGNGYVEFGPQSAQPSTPAANTFRLFANASGKFTWVGANGFLRVFDGTANTADRTYTLPDVTGTMTVLGNASTGSGSVVLQGTPTLTTPVLGVATGTSLALGGCTLGTDVFCTTGTSTFSAAITLPVGSTTVPSLRQPTTWGATYWIYPTGDPGLAFWDGPNSRVDWVLGGPGFKQTASSYIGWTTGTATGGVVTSLTSPATATLQHGKAPNATPVANTVIIGESSRPGTDTNVAGANGTIQSGNGTGNAAGSTLNLQTPVAVAGGTGAQTMTTQIAINSAGITITPALTLSGGQAGTMTNNNAAAGNVGEFNNSIVASGSAVSLTNATATNVTTLSLAAGDYNCWGVVDYTTTGATTTDFKSGISTTSATFGAQDTFVNMPLIATALSDTFGHVLPVVRLSLAGTTTVYLLGQSNFSVGTASGYGTLNCRRVR